jgi:hypothetical protein
MTGGLDLWGSVFKHVWSEFIIFFFFNILMKEIPENHFFESFFESQRWKFSHDDDNFVMFDQFFRFLEVWSTSSIHGIFHLIDLASHASIANICEGHDPFIESSSTDWFKNFCARLYFLLTFGTSESIFVEMWICFFSFRDSLIKR